MDPMDATAFADWIRPILAACIGLLGAGIGAGFVGKKAAGPRERAFKIKVSIVCLIFTGLDIASSFLIPPWWDLVLIIPYVVVLVLEMRNFNELQFQIWKEESGSAAEPDAAPDHGGK